MLKIMSKNLKISLKMEDEVQNKGGIKELKCQKVANKIQNRNVLNNYHDWK